jgi:hypothetical protein
MSPGVWILNWTCVGCGPIVPSDLMTPSAVTWAEDRHQALLGAPPSHSKRGGKHLACRHQVMPFIFLNMERKCKRATTCTLLKDALLWLTFLYGQKTSASKPAAAWTAWRLYLSFFGVFWSVPVAIANCSLANNFVCPATAPNCDSCLH